LELALRAIELSVHENSEKVRSGFPKKVCTVMWQRNGKIKKALF
jgi:hypothetical protein